MVLDRLDNAARYEALSPHFAAAFAYLRQHPLADLAPGRYPVSDGVTAIVDHQPGRGRQATRLEAHRHTIDIQVCLDGRDEIGWRPAGACRHTAADYDPATDTVKYFDEPEQWVSLPAGCFVILFPEDAHAPLGADGPLRKVVVKVGDE